MIVLLAPGARLANVHGNAWAQSPAFDTNVRPAGVASATLIALAVAGPWLVRVNVKLTFALAPAVAGAAIASSRSAEATCETVVLVLALLFAGVSSTVALVTLALATMLAPA